uniref:Putative secreted protein n=1 Tax=Anopheles triannulatus TaxID=58253 RepID=A0A2M4B7J9_9DIPT
MEKRNLKQYLYRGVLLPGVCVSAACCSAAPYTHLSITCRSIATEWSIINDFFCRTRGHSRAHWVCARVRAHARS